MNHKTESIIIKKADIDKEMVIVINWLNAFDSVFTQYCCQGEDKKDGEIHRPPYVKFICEDPIDLVKILKVIGIAGTLRVCRDNADTGTGLRYVLEFPNTDTLRMMNRVLTSPPYSNTRKAKP